MRYAFIPETHSQAQIFEDDALRIEVIGKHLPVVIHQTFANDGDAEDGHYAVAPRCAPSWQMETFSTLVEAEAFCLTHGLSHERLPDHAMIVIGVQTSNMAPKGAKPSDLWYHDSHAGWNYVTSKGYRFFEEIKVQHPEMVRAYDEAKSATIRHNFDLQAGVIRDFIAGK